MHFRALSNYGDNFMIFEISGRPFYLGDDYFAPTWWDNWINGNLKNSKELYWKLKERKKD
jgi:hypothetical protein